MAENTVNRKIDKHTGGRRGREGKYLELVTILYTYSSTFQNKTRSSRAVKQPFLKIFISKQRKHVKGLEPRAKCMCF